MANRHGIPLTPEQRQTLQAARKGLGLTLEGLALQIGVTHVAVIRYESGESRPSIEVLRRWAALVGYEVMEGELELRKRRKRK